MSLATWRTVARCLLIAWLLTVAGVTVYEWNSLPRPSGYFVEAVDPNTGKPHAYGKPKLTRSDLDTEIGRVRSIFQPPRIPTASERLFDNAHDEESPLVAKAAKAVAERAESGAEQAKASSQRWDEILNSDVPYNRIDNSSDRDRLLAEVTSLPVAVVSKNPGAAMRLARLLELRNTMLLSPILELQILDPEFNALSQPAVPRLRWSELLIATIIPPAVFFYFPGLLLLLPRRRKVQLSMREANSEAFATAPPVAAEAESSGRSQARTSNWIIRAYKGHVRLWKVFWLGYVAPLLPLSVVFQLYKETADRLPSWVGLVGFLAGFLYQAFLAVALWRCAPNVDRPIFRRLARAFAVFVGLITLAAALNSLK
jgi:hypothetical protein